MIYETTRLDDVPRPISVGRTDYGVIGGGVKSSFTTRSSDFCAEYEFTTPPLSEKGTPKVFHPSGRPDGSGVYRGVPAFVGLELNGRFSANEHFSPSGGRSPPGTQPVVSRSPAGTHPVLSRPVLSRPAMSERWSDLAMEVYGGQDVNLVMCNAQMERYSSGMKFAPMGGGEAAAHPMRFGAESLMRKSHSVCPAGLPGLFRPLIAGGGEYRESAKNVYPATMKAFDDGGRLDGGASSIPKYINVDGSVMGQSSLSTHNPSTLGIGSSWQLKQVVQSQTRKFTRQSLETWLQQQSGFFAVNDQASYSASDSVTAPHSRATGPLSHFDDDLHESPSLRPSSLTAPKMLTQDATESYASSLPPKPSPTKDRYRYRRRAQAKAKRSPLGPRSKYMATLLEESDSEAPSLHPPWRFYVASEFPMVESKVKWSECATADYWSQVFCC